jgi:hypothetical protein
MSFEEEHIRYLNPKDEKYKLLFLEIIAHIDFLLPDRKSYKAYSQLPEKTFVGVLRHPYKNGYRDYLMTYCRSYGVVSHPLCTTNGELSTLLVCSPENVEFIRYDDLQKLEDYPIVQLQQRQFVDFTKSL